MFAFVAGFVLVLALLGIAGHEDYQANQAMSEGRRMMASSEREQAAAEFTAAGHAPVFSSRR